jgi:hypothetical protein
MLMESEHGGVEWGSEEGVGRKRGGGWEWGEKGGEWGCGRGRKVREWEEGGKKERRRMGRVEGDREVIVRPVRERWLL